MVQLSESGPQIPRFFAGRNLFITGGTGFVGKVLVERLLSTCPEISRLFLLMRPKKGITPEKRLLVMKQCQVFDVIRERNPRQLDKLQAVSGDLAEPMLGLTPEALTELKRVSVVFHAAATIKFNETLRTAVDLNLRPVIRLLDICDSLPELQVFVYVSTAYSNAELPRVEERIYTPRVTLKQVFAAVEEDMTPEEVKEFISPKPNTYTFTKALAEFVIQQRASKDYSTAIIRPTIVVSSLKHPVPGWIDNLNGPSGVIASTGKGLARVIECSGQARGDMLPVDVAVDCILAATKDVANVPTPVRVYNCSTIDNPITWREFGTTVNRHLREHPLNNALWVPAIMHIENRLLYKSLVILLQTIPHYVIEYTTMLLGIKCRHSLIKAHQKVVSMQEALSFFALRDWQFVTGNMRQLRDDMSSEDKAIYNLDPKTIVWEDHLRDFVRGVRKYVLHEREQDLPAARRHMSRLLFISNGSKIIFFLLALRFLIQIPYVKLILGII